MAYSILILTYNEEINIADCLDSVAWADDVVVLDSFSSDETCMIAESKGARVFQRNFDDFGSQRNYALDSIEFKHDWVFHLDADERFNPDLQSECQRVVKLDLMSAYFMPNRIIFLGKWIPRCTQYPFPQVRLVKLGEVRFAMAGHGQKEDEKCAISNVGNCATSHQYLNAEVHQDAYHSTGTHVRCIDIPGEPVDNTATRGNIKESNRGTKHSPQHTVEEERRSVICMYSRESKLTTGEYDGTKAKGGINIQIICLL